MNWKDKNVFITGATGFLGSWLTKLMVDEGVNVIILSRDTVPKSNLWSNKEFNYVKDNITIIHGSLENYHLLERTLNEYNIDIVFHLGAQAIVETANRNPLPTFESNIRGTYNLLEACRRNQYLIKAVVVASSDKAYGVHEELPYTEDMALQGIYPYDVSKSCVDLISLSYYKTYHLPLCVARCGNLFGPGDNNLSRIIPYTITSIINDKQPELRSDGNYIRDFLYVKDGALAYKYLVEMMIDSSIFGEAFNFSNECKITILELVNKIIRMMDCNFKPIILNNAKNEIRNQYLSTDKAKSLLHWKPKYTLEEGLKETIDYYRNQIST